MEPVTQTRNKEMETTEAIERLSGEFRGPAVAVYMLAAGDTRAAGSFV
jgi:hypothetical protein